MRLFVNFSEINSDIHAKFIQTECSFNANFGEIVQITTGDIYQGDYDVVPRVYQQVLPTKDKVMVDNITIEIIPLTKVINLQNGYTVTIG